MEHLTCNDCGLIVLISSIKVNDKSWDSTTEDRKKFLCSFCNEAAPEARKFRIAPHKLPEKQALGAIIEESDPYESLLGEHDQKHKPTPKIEDSDPHERILGH